MQGKQFTDLTKASVLKDSDIFAVHDGNGLKKSSMGDVTAYMSDKFSNPNLLINPNFKINQRGKAEYTSDGVVRYTVDRWRNLSLNVNASTDGISLSADSQNNDGGFFAQELERPIDSETLFTLKVDSVTGSIVVSVMDSTSNGNNLNITTSGIYSIGLASQAKKVIIQVTKGSSCKIEWVKLEQGSIATPFVAPNPAEELVKCARFLQIIPEIYFIPYASTRTAFSSNGQYYQSAGGLFPVEMRTNPTITYSNIHKANDEVISEKVTSVDSNKYGIGLVVIGNNVDYYTLRMKNIIADAEIY
jgi:hypothetical protein|nr:MAG TPA_asm: tail fiber protein [Caudoviricetes sp.]